jgi:hypothetical protein
MLAIVAGHETPTDIFYELKSNRFMLNELASVNAEGEIIFKNK